MVPISLASPFRGNAWHVAETGSTMSDAKTLAEAAPGLPGIVIADHQLSGRGRLEGRTWVDTPGLSLLCTVWMPREMAPPGPFPLVAGLAVVRAIEACLLEPGLPLEPEIRLKWPNDVLLDGKKVCGILCESDGRSLFAGIGVNLAQTSFPGLSDFRCPPTSVLLSCGRAPDRFRFAELALESLFSPVPDWKERMESRLWRRGEPVRFRVGGDSGEILDGRLAGTGDDGALLLETDSGTVACVSGELLHGRNIDGGTPA